MKWHLYPSFKRNATENMLLDEKLLNETQELPQIILHIHEWQKPSITYGCFIPIEKYISLKNTLALNWDIAKRPTGGGIVFHQWDFSFSLIVPSSFYLFSEKNLKNYEWVNQIVHDTLKEILADELFFFEKREKAHDFCFANPTFFDIGVKGKKIAGAALRQKKYGFLYQGSILLYPLEEKLLELLLLNPEKDLLKIMHNSYPIFKKKSERDREEIKNLFLKHLQKRMK